MSAVQLPVTVGEVIADKYRIDRVVGSGGMSIVLLAWHLELEQEVAIKVLQGADVESDAAKRFRREARAAARIRSEHVSRVLDVGTLPNGSPFMVMEYLIGNDLAEELGRRGPLPVEEVVLYVLQAIEALSEAHAAGIVHRDLKPENLFLGLRPDGSRAIKVLDFGISKSIAPSTLAELSLTKTASFVGSPLYMSPEQMRSSRSVDGRTDIWSIGAIMYEAISGRLPYYAESIGELCTRLLQDSPPPLGELRSGLPPGFETVVLRCLEKERDRRYTSLAELARALVPFAAGAASYAERSERVLAMAGLSATAVSKVSPAASQNSQRVTRPSSLSLSSRVNLASSDMGVQPRNTRPASWVKTYAEEIRRRKGPLAFGLVVGLGIGFAWAFGFNARHESVAVSQPETRPETLTVSAVAAARPAVEPAAEDRIQGRSNTLDSAPETAPPDSGVAPTHGATERPKTRSSHPRWAAAHGRTAQPATTPENGATAQPAPAAARAVPNGTPTAGATINAWDPSAFGGRH